MRERVRARAEQTWRILLLIAIGMLTLAAFCTAVGANTIGHGAGALAWAAGLLGAVGGLLSERPDEDAP
jgi:lipopolysaccharide export LptBFGC system permease protein LptF